MIVVLLFLLSKFSVTSTAEELFTFRCLPAIINNKIMIWGYLWFMISSYITKVLELPPSIDVNF